MVVYDRTISLKGLLKEKSHFLFGPRSTGKTTLIQRELSSDAIVFDLLDRDVYRRLLKDPKLLSETPKDKCVVIDEIQKLPHLLDEVQRLLQGGNRFFLLTGSSARKLKRGAGNLLAGRAWKANLFPLTSREIKDFDLLKYLNRGGLPQVYNSKNYQREISEYISLYLREEVASEALTRNIEAFSEFLDLVGVSNGMEINYQSFANDCGISVNTAKNYFSILKDTLVGFDVNAFIKTRKRKAISRSKHYLFDLGVTNGLKNIWELTPESPQFGKAFEHFIMLEVRAYLSYNNIRKKQMYWRSTYGQEVDLIIGEELAVEIKATKRVQEKHLRGLRALMEEGMIRNYCIISLDPYTRVTEDGIRILPWDKFLSQIFSQK